MRKLLIAIFFLTIAGACKEKKVVESKYDNGKPRVVKYFHKDNGEMVLDKESIYYKNGQKNMEGSYKDMQRDGHWTAWYENGTIWSEGDYKDGKRNGMGIAYHRNGKKYIEGMYKDDERVGVWHFYDTTGTLIKEVNFDIVPKTGEPEKK